jgi:uncharacterized protein YggU (UPF0235/DUF167 family)
VASVEHAAHTTAPTRLRVRVSAGARRSAVVGRYGDGWKLRVHAAPERGRANAEVVDLLAGVLGLAPQAVRIVAGHAARDKVVELDRLSPAEAERRLSTREQTR